MIRPHVYVGRDALGQLKEYVGQAGYRRLALVADRNTYEVLGGAAERELRAVGCDVQPIVLKGDEILVDETQIVDVMVRNDARDRVFLAVGSGTVTDITRFVSFQLGAAFISLPTAPSVDAYTSPSSPILLRRLKVSVPGQLPEAVFADSNVLAAAPKAMIAAGAGDVFAKWTSTADWRLGQLLWGNEYDESIAARYTQALGSVAGAADEIGRASEAGICTLMDALIECGLCMADFGSSLPASGTEHHLAHYWEMRLHAENRPALLHGAKVGVGVVIAAGFWQQVRGLDRAEAGRRLAAWRPVERAAEVSAIRAGWSFAVDQVMAEQARFLNMSEGDWQTLKGQIVERWDDIRAIAADVPSAQEVVAALRKVGGPAYPHELGLEARDVEDALAYARYLRDRLTVMRLRGMLKMD